jgi:ribosomal protein L11 methyltransferase
MRWIEAKVIFEFENKELAADLISNVFHEFGLQGVVIETPGGFEQDDWADDAAGFPEYDAVTGYVPEDHKAARRCRTLEEQLKRLEKEIGVKYHVHYSHIDEVDWSESWKAYFWPEKVGAAIVIKPTWRQYETDEDEIVLEIDPGMAFGTGTHATTALCIELMETYLKKGDSFLDVGTGSGVLMVAAAKLGAKKMCGVDNDENAIEVAEKNLRVNRIEDETFELINGDLVGRVSERFNMVVANITLKANLSLLDDVKQVMKDSGTFICAGMIEKDKTRILTKIENQDFDVLEIRTKEGWVAVAGRKKSPPFQEGLLSITNS